MAEWLWPLPGYNVIERSVSSGHNGIDIHGNYPGECKGAAIVASRAGRVTRSGWSDSYGYVVYMEHDGGYQTRYAHMIQSPSVNVGDTIGQGVTVGYCGTTGNSTGYHLHFEIRLNGTVLEPKNYISSTNTTTPPKSISSEPVVESTSYTSTTSNVPYTPLQIVGRRVADITAQPSHAFVEISIGSNVNNRVVLSTEPPKPNIIQSFTFTRIESAGSTAEFVLFDDSWDFLEETFSNNWDSIYIQYGYANGLRSEIYHMMLQEYSISFNDTGVILSISAISQSAYDNLQPVAAIEIKEGTTNPTDAIRQICIQMGWSTNDLIATEDLSEDLSASLSSINENPITYIQSEILPLISNAGEDPLYFYVDESNRAHLTRKSAVPSNMDDVRTYIYQKGYDSVVKDLSFDYKGVFGGMKLSPTTTGGRLSMIDTETKDLSYLEESVGTVATNETTNYLTMRSNQSIVVMNSSGYTKQQINNKLFYYLKNSASSMFTGTVTIVGDPTIELLDHIRLVNITDAGYLHHTSGIYLVKGITTSLEGGGLSTALSIIRMGDINDGVELINAKSFVK